MKALLTVIFIVAFFITKGFPQLQPQHQHQKKLDSLEHIISNSLGGEKYDRLVASARLIYEENLIQGRDYAARAFDLAKSLGDSMRIVESGRMLGQFYNMLNKYNEALPYLQYVEPIAKRNAYINEYGRILGQLGNIFTFQSKFEKAIQLRYTEITLHEKYYDTLMLGYAHNNLALIYHRIDNIKEALKHYLIAIQLLEGRQNVNMFETILANIGMCYGDLDQPDKAAVYLEKALRHCGTKCPNSLLIAVHYGYGTESKKKGDNEKAKYHLNECLSMALDNARTRNQCDALIVLAEIDVEEGNLAAAEIKLLQLHEIATKSGYDNLRLIGYEQMAIVSKLKGDYQKSIDYFEKHNELKNKIYQQDLLTGIAKIKSDYEQRENLAIIEESNIKLSAQRKLNYALVIIAFLITLFSAVVYRSYVIIKKVNNELTTARDVIYEQNKQLDVRNKHLDHLVDKKTDELKQVNLTLKKMNDELAIFIHKISTEIGAPLSSLKGICELAFIDLKGSSAITYMKQLSAVTDTLSRRLKKLSAINRINQMDLEVEPVNVTHLVDNIVSTYWQYGLPPTVILQKDVQEDVYVQTDNMLLNTMIENSIDNAISLCQLDGAFDTHVINLNVVADQEKVHVRIKFNGKTASQYYNPVDLNVFSAESPFSIFHSKRYDHFFHDTFLIRTAAKKIGAQVNFNISKEGNNEVVLILSNN